MSSPSVLFLLSIVSSILGCIGIWLFMKGIDAFRKNYFLAKYPVISKGIINVCYINCKIYIKVNNNNNKDKYTNKIDKTIDETNAYLIRYSFSATDRNYSSYTISKTDHQMISKFEWTNINVGDFIEVVYCAKNVKLFALHSEQKMRQTQLIPIFFIIASVPFFICLFIPLFLGSIGSMFFAILIAGSIGIVMRLEKICCCDNIWKKCKNKKTVMSIVSEITTLTNDPELHVPSGSDEFDDDYDYDDQVICSLVDTDSNKV